MKIELVVKINNSCFYRLPEWVDMEQFRRSNTHNNLPLLV